MDTLSDIRGLNNLKVKLILTILVFFPLFLVVTKVNAEDASLEAAFVRDGYVWTKIDGQEEQISAATADIPYAPQWSHDGEWLVYVKRMNEADEIWAYQLKTKQHIKVYHNGSNPQWSPTENKLAFQDRGVLNISDLRSFQNIALGVDDYIWYPNGKGFIVSSSASLRPDGWTNPVLYKIDDLSGLTKAEKFFVIPKELSFGNITNMSIFSSYFAFSPNEKWLSFIVGPTASLSMDSNLLCVIGADGTGFEVIAEVITHVDPPQWAKTKNRLGYIAGGGRIVLGYKNKDLHITEIETNETIQLTPSHFADLGFTWVDDESLVVSRTEEAEWSNDPAKRPNSSLYFVRLHDPKQTKITAPPKNFNDTFPIYLPSKELLIWERREEGLYKGDVWMGKADGSSQEKWIENVDSFAVFPEE
ncbi:TolB domain-containing protein [Bacillaceae bacterium Marseille-Q3522]|nr:TolB domain-containing protein [Bacillaceae bacterium Marseille-Q3522]